MECSAFTTWKSLGIAIQKYILSRKFCQSRHGGKPRYDCTQNSLAQISAQILATSTGIYHDSHIKGRAKLCQMTFVFSESYLKRTYGEIMLIEQR